MSPKVSAILISTTTLVLQSLWTDLMGYYRTRAQYLERKEAYDENPIGLQEPRKPRWDWPLFGVRMATAAIGSLLSGLGINAVVPSQP